MHTYPGPGGDLHAQLTRGEQIHLEMHWEEPTRYRLSNETRAVMAPGTPPAPQWPLFPIADSLPEA